MKKMHGVHLCFPCDDMVSLIWMSYDAVAVQEMLSDMLHLVSIEA